MTRHRLVLFCAGALSILYGYMIFGAYSNGSEADPLHYLGLGLAIALLVIEIGSSKKA